MVLDADHAAKITARAQKNRLGQENGHGSSILAASACKISDKIRPS
jgi:hypothetical protein